MARYDIEDENGGKIGEVSSTPDYEQQAINAAGVGMGCVVGLIFQAIFASKLTVGITLFITGVVLFAVAAGEGVQGGVEGGRGGIRLYARRDRARRLVGLPAVLDRARRDWSVVGAEATQGAEDRTAAR